MLIVRDLSVPVISFQAEYEFVLSEIEVVRGRAREAAPGLGAIYDAVADGLGSQIGRLIAYASEVAMVGTGAASSTGPLA